MINKTNKEEITNSNYLNKKFINYQLVLLTQ